MEGGQGGQPIGSEAHRKKNHFVSLEIVLRLRTGAWKAGGSGGRRVIKMKRPSLLTGGGSSFERKQREGRRGSGDGSRGPASISRSTCPAAQHMKIARESAVGGEGWGVKPKRALAMMTLKLDQDCDANRLQQPVAFKHFTCTCRLIRLR